VSGYESGAVTLREENRQSVFRNRKLRRIFVPKGKEVGRDWITFLG